MTKSTLLKLEKTVWNPGQGKSLYNDQWLNEGGKEEEVRRTITKRERHGGSWFRQLSQLCNWNQNWLGWKYKFKSEITKSIPRATVFICRDGIDPKSLRRSLACFLGKTHSNAQQGHLRAISKYKLIWSSYQMGNSHVLYIVWSFLLKCNYGNEIKKQLLKSCTRNNEFYLTREFV